MTRARQALAGLALAILAAAPQASGQGYPNKPVRTERWGKVIREQKITLE